MGSGLLLRIRLLPVLALSGVRDVAPRLGLGLGARPSPDARAGRRRPRARARAGRRARRGAPH
jgi:hypothetical protein